MGNSSLSSASSVIAVVALLAGCEAPRNAGASFGVPSSREIWRCDDHFLSDYNMSAADAGGLQEGISYLYIGARGLKTDYLASATFTLPRTDQRSGWYANSIVLKPMADDRVFVSLMLIRNRRFDYNEHVAVAWAAPHAASVSYKDTDLVYLDSSGPHRIGIGVKHRLLSLDVDGQTICRTRSDRFVASNAIKWFQVRTETNAPVHRTTGTVRSISLKRDADASPVPFIVRCEWHGSGVSWLPMGGGRFRAGGTFDPHVATYVDGAERGTKCSGVVR
jgi:hypothetical protein